MKKRKKSLRAAALALCAAMTLSSVPAVNIGTADAAVGDAYYLRGDVVGNDGITALDALEIQKSLLKLVELDEVQTYAANANGDELLNLADAISIMQWVINQKNEYHTGEFCKVSDQKGGELTLAQAKTNDSINKVWEYEAEEDGFYKLRIQYTNSSAANVEQIKQVIVNDNDFYAPAQFVLAPDLTETYAVVELTQGVNTITLRDESGRTGLVNIEQIDVFRTVNPLSPIYPLDKQPETTTVPPTTTRAVETTTPPPPETTTTVYYEETTTATAEPETTTAPEETTTTTVQVPTTSATTTTTTSTTTVIMTTTEPAPAVQRYYAIEAETYDGWEENTNAGFAGKGYFNYNNAIGSYVNWTVDVPTDGNYRITFRYANGTTTNRPTKVMVNGDHTNVIYQDFHGTGTWTDWAENSIVVSLKAGTNTIKARATTVGGGPNMDFIEVEKTTDAATALVKANDGVTVEKLSRGVAMAHASNGNLVSWRILATDNESTTFKLWRIRGDEHTLLGEFSYTDASNYFDSEGLDTDSYTIDTYVGEECTEFAQFSTNFPTANTGNGKTGAYFDIPTQKPAGGTTPDGVTYEYTENDCSVGDVDGDGVYEIFVKWDPSNSKDNANNGYTGSVIIDCYKLDGTMLWRVDLGKNIRAGAHYTQFMVFDFDNDGKAEMICKTADGTKDGKGTVIGDSSKDYRDSSGRVLSGPEYLTLFDGQTGAALDTVDYVPGRGDVSAWGDSYGNRVDRFTGCVAYLDGTNAYACFGRGYYTRMAVTAWSVQNKKLKQYWAWDTGHNVSAKGYGDGNHHCMGADVDGDGKQEVVCGSVIVDDNGTVLNTTSLAHGDAIHVGDFDPTNPGLEIFQCLEDEKHPNGTTVNFGTILRDAKTAKVLFRETAGGDTGRAIADNFIAGNGGAEMSGSHNLVLYSCTGDHANLGNWFTKWGQNSLVYWTGDLERSALDRTMVDDYKHGRVFTGDGVTYNNYTKSNACLTCDLMGDWREEMIFRKSDGGLRVFTTTMETEYSIPTFMHNPQYRVQVASQNNGYNQPPHTDFYLDSTAAIPAAHEVHTAK